MSGRLRKCNGESDQERRTEFIPFTLLQFGPTESGMNSALQRMTEERNEFRSRTHDNHPATFYAIRRAPRNAHLSAQPAALAAGRRDLLCYVATGGLHPGTAPQSLG